MIINIRNFSGKRIALELGDFFWLLPPEGYLTVYNGEIFILDFFCPEIPCLNEYEVIERKEFDSLRGAFPFSENTFYITPYSSLYISGVKNVLPCDGQMFLEGGKARIGISYGHDGSSSYRIRNFTGKDRLLVSSLYDGIYFLCQREGIIRTEENFDYFFDLFRPAYTSEEDKEDKDEPEIIKSIHFPMGEYPLDNKEYNNIFLARRWNERTGAFRKELPLGEIITCSKEGSVRVF